MPPLVRGSVPLWVFKYSAVSDGETRRLKTLLHSHELERNSRFLRTEHRKRDIICRGAMRELLCHYLRIPNKQLQLSRNENGKPYILSPVDDIQFNYSHSGDYAAIAICRGPQIGVDIEYCQRSSNLSAISQRYFAKEEVAALRALPPAAQKHRFFQYWTLKEAYIKARGEGIYLGLDKFRFELDEKKPDDIKIRFASVEFDTVDHWQFLQFASLDNYLVSVAIKDSDEAYFLETDLRTSL